MTAISTGLADRIRDLLIAGDVHQVFRLLTRHNAIDHFDQLGLSHGDPIFLQSINFWVGKIDHIDDEFFYLKEAAWVADMGRFYDCVNSGFSENIRSDVEPFPPDLVVRVRREAVVTWFPWPHDCRLIAPRR